MDNRKRIRLASGGSSGGGGGASVGASTTTTNFTNCTISTGPQVLGIGSTTNGAATLLTNIGAGGSHSYYLTSGSETLEIPANVFLTLCGDDDNSNESQEFLIETTTTGTPCHTEPPQMHIKEEPTTTTVTGGSGAMSMQYRLVNPRKLQQKTSSPPPQHPLPLLSSTTPSSGPTAALLPASLQLPSGCEIYLVKEYVDVDSPLAAPTGQPAATQPNSASTTIKLEPNLCLVAGQQTTSTSAALQQTQYVRAAATSMPALAKLPTHSAPIALGKVVAVETPSTTTPNSGSGSGDEFKTTAARSYILDAYKKRDDKRRATHNEVERRRRDKINSWIFKLKEMLPAEGAVLSADSANAKDPSPSAWTSSVGGQQQQQPRKLCDSKSQILIKACEYIKVMQDELKNLRECLTANEHETQRLQTELNLYKSTQVSPNSNNNNNNSSKCLAKTSAISTPPLPPTSSVATSNGSLLLDESLNSSSFYSLVDPSSSSSSLGLKDDGVHDDDDDAEDEVNGLTSNFTKRELIITDYVD